MDDKDFQELLDAIKTRKPPMSVKSDDLGGGAFGDYGVPDDDLWEKVEVAAMTGKISEEQYDQLYDARQG